MKPILSAIGLMLTCVVTAFWPEAANAASCLCHVQCPIPTDGTYDTGNVSVASGINSFLGFFTGAQWIQCDNDCTNYVNNSLDVAAIGSMAQQHNYCGPVSCTSKHHLGRRPDRTGASRIVNVPCAETSGETGPSQYAVKFVCGTSPVDVPVERGTYSTMVNVHNPHNEDVPFRWKAAFAIGQIDGPITGFTNTLIGADAAQRFDCSLVPTLSILTDGFFVIQAAEPLDVTAYYTGGQPAVTALHVDTVTRRAISKGDLLCKSDFTVQLDDPNSWAMTTGSAPFNVPPAPIGWEPGRTWMSYAADGLSGTNMNTTFGMNFCSCSGKGGSIQGDVRSDNGSDGTFFPPAQPSQSLFPTITGNGNFNSSHGPAVPFSMSFTGAGDGSVAVNLTNASGPSGISFTGQLTLDSGYAGKCQ